MIWITFALLLASSAVLLVFRVKGEDTVADPVAHFKAQLAEVDEDEARGAIDENSAQTARIELKRRILRVTEQAEAEPALTGKNLPKSVLSISILVVSVLLSGAMYSQLGSPGTPASASQKTQAATDRPLEEGGPTLGSALQQVQDHLSRNPRDTEGWNVLARTARSVGDYALAAEAYGELARLEPNEPNWRVEEFEAYLAHGGGKVTPAAQLVLSALLSEREDHPAGQYYLGLTRLQSGDADGARAIWTALADRSARDAPWMPALQNQLQSLGVNPPALSARDMAVVEGMSDEDRFAFIQSMLDRLENRLDSAPNDPEGWLMLARSYLALGDKDAAISSLNRGISVIRPEDSGQLRAFLDNISADTDP